MPVGATIGAIGSLGSAGIGFMGAQSAAKAQTQQFQQALAFQQQVYQQNQQNLSPYMGFGKSAANSLAAFYGLTTPDNPGGAASMGKAWENFQNLPAYQFPFEQGQRALNMNLNAQGRQLSGAQTRASQQFGQGLASTYMMQNYVNPLSQYASMGANAAGSLAGTNAQMANTIGNTFGNIGGAQASGIVGGTNALTGGMSNLAAYGMMSQMPGFGGVSSYGSPMSLSASAPWGGTLGGTGGMFGGMT